MSLAFRSFHSTLQCLRLWILSQYWRVFMAAALLLVVWMVIPSFSSTRSHPTSEDASMARPSADEISTRRAAEEDRRSVSLSRRIDAIRNQYLRISEAWNTIESRMDSLRSERTKEKMTEVKVFEIADLHREHSSNDTPLPSSKLNEVTLNTTRSSCISVPTSPFGSLPGHGTLPVMDSILWRLQRNAPVILTMAVDEEQVHMVLNSLCLLEGMGQKANVIVLVDDSRVVEIFRLAGILHVSLARKSFLSTDESDGVDMQSSCPIGSMCHAPSLAVILRGAAQLIDHGYDVMMVDGYSIPLVLPSTLSSHIQPRGCSFVVSPEEAQVQGSEPSTHRRESHSSKGLITQSSTLQQSFIRSSSSSLRILREMISILESKSSTPDRTVSVFGSSLVSLDKEISLIFDPSFISNPSSINVSVIAEYQQNVSMTAVPISPSLNRSETPSSLASDIILPRPSLKEAITDDGSPCSVCVLSPLIVPTSHAFIRNSEKFSRAVRQSNIIAYDFVGVVGSSEKMAFMKSVDLLRVHMVGERFECTHPPRSSIFGDPIESSPTSVSEIINTFAFPTDRRRVVFVFAVTGDYNKVLLNQLCSLDLLGETNLLVVALDAQSADFARSRGIRHVFISNPSHPVHSISPSPRLSCPFGQRCRQSILLERMKIARQLLAHDIDVIQLDIDVLPSDLVISAVQSQSVLISYPGILSGEWVNDNIVCDITFQSNAKYGISGQEDSIPRYFDESLESPFDPKSQPPVRSSSGDKSGVHFGLGALSASVFSLRARKERTRQILDAMIDYFDKTLILKPRSGSDAAMSFAFLAKQVLVSKALTGLWSGMRLLRGAEFSSASLFRSPSTRSLLQTQSVDMIQKDDRIREDTRICAFAPSSILSLHNPSSVKNGSSALDDRLTQAESFFVRTRGFSLEDARVRLEQRKLWLLRSDGEHFQCGHSDKHPSESPLFGLDLKASAPCPQSARSQT